MFQSPGLCSDKLSVQTDTSPTLSPQTTREDDTSDSGFCSDISSISGQKRRAELIDPPESLQQADRCAEALGVMKAQLTFVECGVIDASDLDAGQHDRGQDYRADLSQCLRKCRRNLLVERGYVVLRDLKVGYAVYYQAKVAAMMRQLDVIDEGEAVVIRHQEKIEQYIQLAETFLANAEFYTSLLERVDAMTDNALAQEKARLERNVGLLSEKWANATQKTAPILQLELDAHQKELNALTAAEDATDIDSLMSEVHQPDGELILDLDWGSPTMQRYFDGNAPTYYQKTQSENPDLSTSLDLS